MGEKYASWGEGRLGELPGGNVAQEPNQEVNARGEESRFRPEDYRPTRIGGACQRIYFARRSRQKRMNENSSL